MEEGLQIFSVAEKIYVIRSRGQLKKDGHSASGSGEVLKTPHNKNLSCYGKSDRD
jgi:hypothetical protein